LLSIHSLRIAAVFVAMAAWIGATNHCALRCFEGAAQQCCCPVHQPDPPKDGAPQGVTCCTSLRAVLHSPLRAPAGATSAAAMLADRSPELAWNAADGRQAPQIKDTGPPAVFSFAERVLQHSLLSHAPPLAG
jgi:hypothetical protein